MFVKKLPDRAWGYFESSWKPSQVLYEKLPDELIVQCPRCKQSITENLFEHILNCENENRSLSLSRVSSEDGSRSEKKETLNE